MKKNLPLQDKLTTRLKSVLKDALNASYEMDHAKVTTAHLLYGMLKSPGGLAYSVLTLNGFDLKTIKAYLDLQDKKPVPAKPSYSKVACKALERAFRYAHRFQHKYIGTEHLLFGIISLKKSLGYRVLVKSRLNIPNLERHLRVILQGTSKFPNLSHFFGNLSLPQPPFSQKEYNKTGKFAALDYFCTDLTKQAETGKLDPVIGREKEIQRVINILNRKTKNNPVLIGEPGVGKTAIVLGLAQKIAQGKVPYSLADKRILSLDMASVVAGTTFRGEFEDRLKDILREAKTNPHVILFIDEMHTIVGAGSTTGSLDAANILKPALSRGELQVIGATTLDEYRKHIEKDAALERRFQPVIVRESSLEETREILKGLKSSYEKHHHLVIADEALDAAVSLSKRYVSDRFLPDKAIDLLDEAASFARMRASAPSFAAQIKKLQDEEMHIAKEKEHAIATEDYEKALFLKKGSEALKKKITVLENRSAKGKVSEITVTPEDVAKVVAEMTGVPVTSLLKAESKKLKNLEKILGKHILGQEEAITLVSQYIRRSRAGLAPGERPAGSFIFLGPTGVGKTELAKVLAKEVFEDENALIRVDMSEFREAHTVSKLIGAPAGYVGYEEGGKLTEAVRRRPYCVVLFDEIEKAHSDVFNILLQILEEGALTDGHGRKINFKNTIVILTSNLGSVDLAKEAKMGFDLKEDKEARESNKYQEIKEKILGKLKETMSPELLSRFDQIIVFKPLNLPALKQIAQLQLEKLKERVREKGLSLEITPKVKDFLAKKVEERIEGARPLRQMLQNYIEDPLATGLIEEEYKKGDVIEVKVVKDGVKLKKK